MGQTSGQERSRSEESRLKKGQESLGAGEVVRTQGPGESRLRNCQESLGAGEVVRARRVKA